MICIRCSSTMLQLLLHRVSSLFAKWIPTAVVCTHFICVLHMICIRCSSTMPQLFCLHLVSSLFAKWMPTAVVCTHYICVLHMVCIRCSRTMPLCFASGFLTVCKMDAHRHGLHTLRLKSPWRWWGSCFWKVESLRGGLQHAGGWRARRAAALQTKQGHTNRPRSGAYKDEVPSQKGSTTGWPTTSVDVRRCPVPGLPKRSPILKLTRRGIRRPCFSRALACRGSLPKAETFRFLPGSPKWT